MRQGLTMADEAKPPTLEYETKPVLRRKAARIYYCIGLPMMSFGLGMGMGRDGFLCGSVMAIGAFLVAMALPVRD
jgi:hypothetical protein